MKKVKLLCLVLVAMSFPRAWSQDPKDAEPSTEKLQAEFLGIHLGCSMEELQAILKKSGRPMKLVNKEVSNGTTMHVFSGSHRLNGATGSVFSFWESKLCAVTVYFRSEEAGRIYEALKLKMQEKYGKMADDIKVAGAKCTLTKDGMMFWIEHDAKPFEEDTVIVGAAHLGMLAAKAAKDVEEKAAELGDL